MSAHIVIEQAVDRATLRTPVPRTAFKGQAVYRVMFPAGLTMYKLTHGGAVDRRRGIATNAQGHVTPWWFSYESVDAHSAHGSVAIRGIADTVTGASRAAANLPQYLRSRGAVCYDWNDMTHLLVVELAREVVGLVGLCSGQPLFEDAATRTSKGCWNVSFIGGEQQLFLPGLHPHDLAVRQFGPAL